LSTPEFMRQALREHQAKLLKPGMSADDIRQRNVYRLGNANWEAFQALGCDIGMFLEAAEDWKKALDGIQYPWLVWSMLDDWCYVQQKLVESAGWTPIVGYDPRHPPTKLTKNAVLIDFNARLKLPVMWMHVPIDFIFMLAPRMAFWHADLLCSPQNMTYLSDLFRGLRDGEGAIVNPTSKLGLGRFLAPHTFRYWELAGCFTRGASQHMFDHGCSIYQQFMFHPNCPSEEEFKRRLKYYWDSGSGIYYWHRRYQPSLHLIPEKRLDAGHFTRITRKETFKTVSPNNELRDGGADLQANFTIEQAVRKVGLDPKILEVD